METAGSIRRELEVLVRGARRAGRGVVLEPEGEGLVRRRRRRCDEQAQEAGGLALDKRRRVPTTTTSAAMWNRS